MHKKNKDTAKINLPLGQAWHLLSFRYHCTDHIAKEYRTLKRQIFSSPPRVESDILAGFITTYSVYLVSDDPEIFVLLFIYLIYLYYTFI